MNKPKALKIVNPILGLLMVSQCLSGMLAELLPPIWFEVLHQGGGLLLILVAALHVILNWPWIRATYFTQSPTPASRP